MSDSKGVGRPIIYSQEIADKICEEIATSSKSLRTICNEDGMPSVGTLLKWMRENTNNFLTQYTRAKEEQADFMAEEMLDIADDGSNDLMTITKGDRSYELENKEVVNRSKLRIETRKWLSSKLKPKKYGDKLDLTSGGDKLPQPVSTPQIIIQAKNADIPISEKLEDE